MEFDKDTREWKKLPRIDTQRFYGLNLNPLPLEFSNELSTTEWLCAILKQVNDLIADINEIVDWMNSIESTWESYTDEEIAKLDTKLQELIASTKAALELLIAQNRSEVDASIKANRDAVDAEIVKNRTEVDASIKANRDEVDTNITALRAELLMSIQSNRSELDALIDALRDRIVALETSTASKDYTDAEIAKLREYLINLYNALNLATVKLNDRCDVLDKRIRVLEDLTHQGNLWVISPLTGKKTSIGDALYDVWHQPQEWVTYAEGDTSERTYEYLDGLDISYREFMLFTARHLGIDAITKTAMARV